MVFCTDLLSSFSLLLHKDDTVCKMKHAAVSTIKPLREEVRVGASTV